MDHDGLDAFRDVVPDAPDVPLPRMGWKDEYTLNRQTAFNRGLLASREECGCFHCGRRFPTRLVTEWMEEPDGEDTGVCPYCGVDALIVGDEVHPLTTSLLTMLYERWFREELRELDGDRTRRALPYRSRGDYLRKGIPFRTEAVDPEYWEGMERRRRWEALERGAVMDMGIWSVGVPGTEAWDCYGTHVPLDAVGRDLGGTWAIHACEEACFTEYAVLTKDDDMLVVLPQRDRQRAVLEELIARYSTALKGQLSGAGDKGVELTVFLRR